MKVASSGLLTLAWTIAVTVVSRVTHLYETFRPITVEMTPLHAGRYFVMRYSAAFGNSKSVIQYNRI
jgi:hypothetical protein